MCLTVCGIETLPQRRPRPYLGCSFTAKIRGFKGVVHTRDFQSRNNRNNMTHCDEKVPQPSATGTVQIRFSESFFQTGDRN